MAQIKVTYYRRITWVELLENFGALSGEITNIGGELYEKEVL